MALITINVYAVVISIDTFITSICTVDFIPKCTIITKNVYAIIVAIIVIDSPMFATIIAFVTSILLTRLVLIFLLFLFIYLNIFCKILLLSLL